MSPLEICFNNLFNIIFLNTLFVDFLYIYLEDFGIGIIFVHKEFNYTYHHYKYETEIKHIIYYSYVSINAKIQKNVEFGGSPYKQFRGGADILNSNRLSSERS